MLKDVFVCPVCKILLCLLLFALRFLFGYLFGILLFFFCRIRKAFGTEQAGQLKGILKNTFDIDHGIEYNFVTLLFCLFVMNRIGS